MTGRGERPQAAPVPSAALVALHRPGAGGLRVLLGRRSRRARFLGGWWAFPGGVLEEVDGAAEDRAALARCAAREFHEETGLRIDPEGLAFAGRRTTPPFVRRRFATAFFVALLSGDAPPEPTPETDELEELAWLAPGEALAAWRSGRLPVAPPVLPMLRALAAVAPEAAPPDIAARLEDVNRREQECPRIEVAPGAWLVPLATETLPPATHTNAALVGGRRFVVVDPGSRDAAELEHLLCLVERRVAEGGAPHAVVLTHHHGDHVGGAAAAAARLAVPVLAHPRTVDLLRDEALRGVARGALDDGARLDLDGETLRVVHTPGHAPGHVALVAERARVAIVGDLVSGVSSIVIPPDTGDMGAFLDSLARVAREPVGLVLPGHGPPLSPEALETAREHRLARERAVLDALGAEPRPLEEIARAAYRGERVHERFAAVQTLAHLRHLAARGRARERDGGWQLAG